MALLKFRFDGALHLDVINVNFQLNARKIKSGADLEKFHDVPFLWQFAESKFAGREYGEMEAELDQQRIWHFFGNLAVYSISRYPRISEEQTVSIALCPIPNEETLWILGMHFGDDYDLEHWWQNQIRRRIFGKYPTIHATGG